jgi:solute carrier family 35 protein F1/2
MNPLNIPSLLPSQGALFSFYLLVPSVLIQGGAAVLNVSLLTSDLWAAGAR